MNKNTRILVTEFIHEVKSLRLHRNKTASYMGDVLSDALEVYYDSFQSYYPQGDVEEAPFYMALSVGDFKEALRLAPSRSIRRRIISMRKYMSLK